MLPYGQEAPEEKRPLTRGTVEDSRKTNRRGNQIPPTKSSRAVRALPEAARWVTLGLAPPGNEIPPLHGRQKPLQDPTPVERARTVTRMAGVFEPCPFRGVLPHPTNKSALRAERPTHLLAAKKPGWPPTSTWTMVSLPTPHAPRRQASGVRSCADPPPLATARHRQAG